MLWALVNTFFRGAAALLLHRLFGTNTGSYAHVLTIASIVFSLLHGLAALLTAVLICRPMRAAWDNHVGGNCGNQVSAYVGLEISGLLLDLWIMLMPMWLARKLKMPMRRKAGVISVLSIGGL